MPSKQDFVKRIARPPWGHPGICNETRVPLAIEICLAPPIALQGATRKARKAHMDSLGGTREAGKD